MPSSAYIDLKNQTKRRFSVIASKGAAAARQSPGNEMPPAYPRQPNVHPNRPVIASKGAAVAWQPRGREKPYLRTRYQPIVHQNRPVIASKGVAVAWQSPEREDLLAYTLPTNRTPEPPCHCERRRSRSAATSRKRNAARVHATNQTYTQTALSLRAKRGNLPEGKTYLRTRTKTLSVGDFSTAFGLSSSLRSK